MRRVIVTLILAVMGLAGLLVAQTTAAPAPAGQTAAAPTAAIKIVAPRAGERLAQQFVNLQYQLTNPGATAEASPNFRVQLDNQDPVLTTATQQSFSGLTPGVHNVTVQLVDANNTPVTGASASVQFTVVNPNAQQAPAPTTPRAATEDDGDPSSMMPSAGSPLPLLSVIGFGVLVGGIVSALKTR
jgi:hypothetical protein